MKSIGIVTDSYGEISHKEADRLCDKFSLGLSCHIGEGALGVGCSCRPKR